VERLFTMDIKNLSLLKPGVQAVHIPYRTTWIHETTDENPDDFPGFPALALFNIPLLKSIPVTYISPP